VLVIDCTTMGALPPMMTPETLTLCRLLVWFMKYCLRFRWRVIVKNIRRQGKKYALETLYARRIRTRRLPRHLFSGFVNLS